MLSHAANHCQSRSWATSCHVRREALQELATAGPVRHMMRFSYHLWALGSPDKCNCHSAHPASYYHGGGISRGCALLGSNYPSGHLPNPTAFASPPKHPRQLGVHSVPARDSPALPVSLTAHTSTDIGQNQGRGRRGWVSQWSPRRVSVAVQGVVSRSDGPC